MVVVETGLEVVVVPALVVVTALVVVVVDGGTDVPPHALTEHQSEHCTNQSHSVCHSLGTQLPVSDAVGVPEP